MGGGIVNLAIGSPSISIVSTTTKRSCRSLPFQLTKLDSSVDQNWCRLQHKLTTNANARFICLFSNNKKQEQARKALDGALSGKKIEFENWDKEIKRREERGGGGASGGGGGGRFGWGRWFGWSNDDNFWREAKQASLTILGIILIFLLVTSGDLLLAVIINPLLYALRGVRDGFGLPSKFLKSTSNRNQPDFDGVLKKEGYKSASAKENVVRKWG